MPIARWCRGMIRPLLLDGFAVELGGPIPVAADRTERLSGSTAMHFPERWQVANTLAMLPSRPAIQVFNTHDSSSRNRSAEEPLG